MLFLLLLAVRDPVVRWADTQPTVAQLTRRAATHRSTVAVIDRAAAVAGAIVRSVLHPPGVLVPTYVTVASLGVLGVELVVAALLLMVQTSAFRTADHTYLRVRIPQSTGGRSTSRATGELFHTLHSLLPTHGVMRGQAPWLALTLGARPDEPVEFGAVVSGGSAVERAGRVAAFRKMLTGADAATLVDEQRARSTFKHLSRY